MRRLFAIGEALIDFIPHVTNSELKDVEQFSRQVGGAPCNVAATVSKLGGHSEMVTQLDMMHLTLLLKPLNALV